MITKIGFGKKTTSSVRFLKFRCERIHHVVEHVLCANFVEFGRPEIGKVMRYLPVKKNKKSARSPALASARIAPKICQGQLQTICSECPKFHPNPFTCGEVIAERVNVVQTRHKVFPILGEASASSPSKDLELAPRPAKIAQRITSAKCSRPVNKYSKHHNEQKLVLRVFLM